MDLEVLELVNKALEALEAHKSNDAYFILKDAVKIYDERFEAEYEAHYDAFGLGGKVTIQVSEPTETQAKGELR